MVVANSSVFIALSFIDSLHLLKKMFNQVIVPEAVWQAVVETGHGEPGASEVKSAQWITTREIENTLLVRALQESPDRGESEAIVLAIEQQTETILLDEKPAQDQAIYFGLKPLGTLGILIWGTRNQHIPQLKPVLNSLMEEGNFRISTALYQKVLQEAGE